MKKIFIILIFISVNCFAQLTDINLLIDGDSQSTTPNTYTYGYYLDNTYFTSITHTITNVAVYGQTMTDLLSNFQTHLDATYNAGYTNNICIIWCGINDISSTADVDSVINRQIRAVEKANLKGFKTYLCTQRYYDYTPYTAEKCATIDVWNQRMKDSASVANYTVIDLAADTHWNNCSTFYDLPHTYYADYIHPTDDATDIFASIIYDDLNLPATTYYVLKNKLKNKYFKNKLTGKVLKAY